MPGSTVTSSSVRLRTRPCRPAGTSFRVIHRSRHRRTGIWTPPISAAASGLSCSPRQIVAREGEIPVEAGGIGHRFPVDDLLDGLAEQQLLDRQLLLLAR